MLPRGLLKEYAQILSLILRALDVIALMTAGVTAYYYKFGNLSLSKNYVSALLLAALLMLAVFPFFHIYESVRAKGFWKNISNVIRAITTVLVLLAGLAFLTKTGEDYSREWFVWWSLFSLILLIFFRCSLLILLRLMRTNGWNERRVIIIGAGELGAKLAETIHQAIWTGFRITAIFDDHLSDKPTKIADIPVRLMPKDMSTYLETLKEPIDEIWIALPSGTEAKVKKLLHDLRHRTIAIRFVLDILGMDLLTHSIMDLAGFPALNLNTTPMIGINRFVKAVEDKTLALLILILISPIFVLLAIGVKLSSKGPFFFKQLRHGSDGRIIKVYKFRTMYEHNEEDGKVTQATLHDSRITPFGRFLRRTSLDELPQFINVLQGRMSIVGPRPHAISHNEFYKDSIKAYMQRHRVKPGITGWAQVNGWRGETETLEKMQKRVECDLYYIENWSLAFDFKIIFLTFFQGFLNKNAY